MVLAALVALRFAAPGGASAAIPAAALDVTEQFGVNTGVMFNGGRYTPAQIDQQLAALAKTGATVVRSDALWEDVEQQPPIGPLHRYNWSLDDQIVSSLASHGLRWLPIIDYAAPWAKAHPSQIHSAPASNSEYASFAEAVATRYGPGGVFWLENPGVKALPVLTYEIWNEPDNPAFWYPAPNPGAYAAMYTAARSAIKARQGGAEVIVGGLTGPVSFLAAMVAADPGVRGQIDGVGIHPYGPPSQVLAGVRSARLAMDGDGLAAVPMYITEFGWTTRGTRARDLATPAQRPGYIATTIAGLSHSDCGIAALDLYAWTTPQRNTANPEDWFGISPPGAGGSPEVAAFTSAVAAAQVPGAPTLLCSPTAPLPIARVLPVANKLRDSKHSRPASGHAGPSRRRKTACRRGAATHKHRRCRAARRR
ncbi:MAG TPA: hypothetical protein VGH24_07165 [Solirubrobacteraceae bacterium]|jgi:hypothetical protein